MTLSPTFVVIPSTNLFSEFSPPIAIKNGIHGCFSRTMAFEYCGDPSIQVLNIVYVLERTQGVPVEFSARGNIGYHAVLFAYR